MNGSLAVKGIRQNGQTLDSLVGPYPEYRDRYRERSPIHHTDRLSCPIILLQGLEDRVVPPSQAEEMLDAMRRKGCRSPTCRSPGNSTASARQRTPSAPSKPSSLLLPHSRLHPGRHHRTGSDRELLTPARSSAGGVGLSGVGAYLAIHASAAVATSRRPVPHSASVMVSTNSGTSSGTRPVMSQGGTRRGAPDAIAAVERIT